MGSSAGRAREINNRTEMNMDLDSNTEDFQFCDGFGSDWDFIDSV